MLGRHFRPNRGSSVFARSGEEVLGAMDAPDQFQPGYECWTLRREAWLPGFPGMARYVQDRQEAV